MLVERTSAAHGLIFVRLLVLGLMLSLWLIFSEAFGQLILVRGLCNKLILYTGPSGPQCFLDTG